MASGIPNIWLFWTPYPQDGHVTRNMRSERFGLEKHAYV